MRGSKVVTIKDIIEKLEEIKKDEGNLCVTWGDGYWFETVPNIMLLAKNDRTSLPRRICFSCTLPNRSSIRIVTNTDKINRGNWI